MIKELVLARLSLEESFIAGLVPDKDVMCGQLSIDSEAPGIGVGSGDSLVFGKTEIGVTPVNQAQSCAVQVVCLEDTINSDLIE